MFSITPGRFPNLDHTAECTCHQSSGDSLNCRYHYGQSTSKPGHNPKSKPATAKVVVIRSA